MSVDVEDYDEEIQALVADSMLLADELVAITATEELQHTQSTILRDTEAAVDQYSRTIASYRDSLDRLALLEHGVLHGMNKTSTVPSEIVNQLDRLENKMEILRQLIREKITFQPPSAISKETFAFIGSNREMLESIEREVDRIGSLIDGYQVRDVATAMSSIQRKTNKLIQDMDSFLKFNSLQKQTIIGFSNKIFHGNQP